VTKPVVVITGASSGIGAEAARLFAAEGYRVMLAARRQELLEKHVQAIQQRGGEAASVQTDVSDLEQLSFLVENTLDRYGQIDILINNAGMGRLDWLDTLDPEEDIAQQINVNLTAAIQLTRLVLPHLLERGQGQVVNVSSAGAWLAIPTYSVYTATKYGLRGFTRSLRRELRGTGITVTGIYPGAVNSEFDTHAGVDWDFESQTPPWLLLSTTQTAKRILQAVKKGQNQVIIPWVMRAALWGEALFPGLVGRLLSHFFRRKDGKITVWGKDLSP